MALLSCWAMIRLLRTVC